MLVMQDPIYRWAAQYLFIRNTKRELCAPLFIIWVSANKPAVILFHMSLVWWEQSEQSCFSQSEYSDDDSLFWDSSLAPNGSDQSKVVPPTPADLGGWGGAVPTEGGMMAGQKLKSDCVFIVFYKDACYVSSTWRLTRRAVQHQEGRANSATWPINPLSWEEIQIKRLKTIISNLKNTLPPPNSGSESCTEAVRRAAFCAEWLVSDPSWTLSLRWARLRSVSCSSVGASSLSERIFSEPLNDDVHFESLYLVFLTWAFGTVLNLASHTRFSCCRRLQWMMDKPHHSLSQVEQKGPEDVSLTLAPSHAYIPPPVSGARLAYR